MGIQLEPIVLPAVLDSNWEATGHYSRDPGGGGALGPEKYGCVRLNPRPPTPSVRNSLKKTPLSIRSAPRHVNFRAPSMQLFCFLYTPSVHEIVKKISLSAPLDLGLHFMYVDGVFGTLDELSPLSTTLQQVQIAKTD